MSKNSYNLGDRLFWTVDLNPMTSYIGELDLPQKTLVKFTHEETVLLISAALGEVGNFKEAIMLATVNRRCRDAGTDDCGHTHHIDCYCSEDQGSGYLYADEYGECTYCAGEFQIGTITCAGSDNVHRQCPYFHAALDVVGRSDD